MEDDDAHDGIKSEIRRREKLDAIISRHRINMIIQDDEIFFDRFSRFSARNRMMVGKIARFIGVTLYADASGCPSVSPCLPSTVPAVRGPGGGAPHPAVPDGREPEAKNAGP
jgi:hypothetical protein